MYDFNDGLADLSESEHELLNKLYNLTLKVLEDTPGRVAKELRESISNLDKAFDKKIEAARNIITTSITNLANKIWNSKPRKKAQAFISAIAKCFSAMGSAIKKNCGQAFQAVSDRFTQFAERLPSIAKTMEAQPPKSQSWVARIKQAIESKLSSKWLNKSDPRSKLRGIQEGRLEKR